MYVPTKVPIGLIQKSSASVKCSCNFCVMQNAYICASQPHSEKIVLGSVVSFVVTGLCCDNGVYLCSPIGDKETLPNSFKQCVFYDVICHLEDTLDSWLIELARFLSFGYHKYILKSQAITILKSCLYRTLTCFETTFWKINQLSKLSSKRQITP